MHHTMEGVEAIAGDFSMRTLLLKPSKKINATQLGESATIHFYEDQITSIHVFVCVDV